MPPQSYPNLQPLPPVPSHKAGLKYMAVIIILVILLVVTLVFAFWSFGQMKDYKENSDQKASAAVQSAKTEQEKLLKAQFAEAEKEPLKSYTGPAQYGGIKILYPKTWSAYISEANSGDPVNAYFYPDFIPNLSNKDVNYALRVQITGSTYQSILNQYKSKISSGKTRSSAFKPELVKNATVGVRLDGQLNNDKNGSMVILPLRDKTLIIWTENQSNINDLNNFVLKNLTYSP